jgi:hypothetical protein
MEINNTKTKDMINVKTEKKNTEQENKAIDNVFATVIKAAKPINQEQSDPLLIRELVSAVVLDFFNAGSGIKIEHRTRVLIKGEWLQVDRDALQTFLLSYTDRSGVTLTDTYSLFWRGIHRISPGQLCRSWPDMINTARSVQQNIELKKKSC